MLWYCKIYTKNHDSFSSANLLFSGRIRIRFWIWLWSNLFTLKLFSHKVEREFPALWMKCSRMPRTWLCKAVCRSDSDPFLKMTFKLIVSHWSSSHTESKGKFPSLWMKVRRKSRIWLCKAVRGSDLTMTIKKISSHWSSTPTRWNRDFLLCE